MSKSILSFIILKENKMNRMRLAEYIVGGSSMSHLVGRLTHFIRLCYK